MKKTKRILSIVLCVVLSFCLTLSLVACKKDDNSFKLNKTAETVDVGSQVLLSALNAPGAIVWVSDNESVATGAQISSKIDSSAKVVGVSVGTATITAYSGDEEASCTVTVTAAETITITQNGTAVSGTINLTNQNDEVQLGATSSKGHNVAWESSNPLIASVSSTGLVKAIAKGGTATITAKCSDSDNNTGAIKTSVTVKVGDGVSTSYEIPHDDNPVDASKVGKWTQWSEFNNVTNATYEDGTITIEFENNGSRWVNIQLRYLPTEADHIAMGKVYEVAFDATLTFPEGFERANGKVTVNNNVITLNAGSGHYSAYYLQGEGLAFNMMMGYDNGTPSGAWDLTDAKIVLSNITWTERAPIPLTAPDFSINGSNVITINDTNPAGSVKGYILSLYNGTKKVGEVGVTNGATIDVSKILYQGTVTAKIKAIAATALYSDSPVGTSANNTVTVNNEHVQYDLKYNSGSPAAGTWAFWSESWVTFTGQYQDGTVTATFSNNAGNFYDTQIKYKSLHEKGDTYTITLHINVDGTVTGTGRVTINGQVKSLHQGDNTIQLTITEGDGDSLIIMFGVANENNQQEIKAATVTISIDEA